MLGDPPCEIAEVGAQLLDREGKAERPFHLLNAQPPQAARLAETVHGLAKRHQGLIDLVEGRRGAAPAYRGRATGQMVRDRPPELTRGFGQILPRGLGQGLGHAAADRGQVVAKAPQIAGDRLGVRRVGQSIGALAPHLVDEAFHPSECLVQAQLARREGRAIRTPGRVLEQKVQEIAQRQDHGCGRLASSP